MNAERKLRRGQITRNKILEAALSLFARKGYSGTSMRDIAQEANVSLGLTYNYFKSKDDLIEQILKDYSIRLRAWMIKRRSSSSSFEVFIDQSVDMVVEYENYFRLLWSVMLMSSAPEFNRKHAVDLYSKVFSNLSTIIRREYPDCSDAFVESYLHLILGSMINFLINPKVFSPDKIRASLKSVYQ